MYEAGCVKAVLKLCCQLGSTYVASCAGAMYHVASCKLQASYK